MTKPASATMKETADKCRAKFAGSDIEKACPELRALLDLAACDLESAATIIHHNIEASWRPIETAPKDPTQKERLLGYVFPTGIQIMRYSGWGKRSGGFEVLKVCDDGYAIWGEFPATHWMPLPALPVQPST